MKQLPEFLKAIPHKFSPHDTDLLAQAYEFSKNAHEGQKRKSGADYFTHSLEAAIILGKIFPQSQTLAATLLHDVVEDTHISLEEIKKQFGKEVAKLIDGVTKLGNVRLKDGKDKYYVENLRKMFIATSQDIRVILIKLADRLHNMQTIKFLAPEKQIKVSKETLEIYAPIAARLGIASWKDELEDLSFAIVYPKEYEETKKILDEEVKKRHESLKETQKFLVNILHTEGIKFIEVTGRTKRVYSLFHKLKKYNGDTSRIYDIFALRIIAKSTSDCYSALGSIHKHLQPLPGRIKDFIANPKPNGYQSIHTTVRDRFDQIFEIQLRTDLMNEEAERGVAAHWFYSEANKKDNLEKLSTTSWIRELRSWQDEITDPEEFLEHLKIDFFKHRIFVYTPKGDIKDLPIGATVIDFAFAVHTDLGYHMMGAKINNKMSSIYDELEQEDTIEIIKTKKPVAISQDWLKAAKTSGARNKIRVYLKEHDKGILDRIRQLKDVTLPKFFRKK